MCYFKFEREKWHGLKLCHTIVYPKGYLLVSWNLLFKNNIKFIIFVPYLMKNCIKCQILQQIFITLKKTQKIPLKISFIWKALKIIPRWCKYMFVSPSLVCIPEWCICGRTGLWHLRHCPWSPVTSYMICQHLKKCPLDGKCLCGYPKTTTMEVQVYKFKEWPLLLITHR